MKQCSVVGCEETGVFRTNTRPTWCHQHLLGVYADGGLTLLDKFTKTKDHLLTRCSTCEFEGHYRFEYVLECIARKEKVCRACFWKRWAADSRTFSSAGTPSATQVKEHAENSGFTYLGPLTNPSLENDPHGTKCSACGRIEAQRAGDIGWGCSCQKNQKTSSAGVKKTPGHNLLKNSTNKAAEWWDHGRNPKVLWETAKLRGRQTVWWTCGSEHSFQEQIFNVTRSSSGCPQCVEVAQAERTRERLKYQGLTVAEVPELLEAWVDDNLAELVLIDVISGNSGYRFRCPKGHTSTRSPYTWLSSGCSPCKGAETRRRNKDAAQQDQNFSRLTPEISSQWHPTKNVDLKIGQVSPGSRRLVWWLDPVCGHEFQDTPRNRDKYDRYRCLECKTILDSLAYHYPDVAEEWAPENSQSPWQVRPTASKLTETPTWVCPNNPEHRWLATPSARVNSSFCPMCKTVGKSRIEMLYAEAADNQWGTALSGQRVHSNEFTNHSSWSVDVLVPLVDERSLAIEYDGSYWHKDKVNLDYVKTLDLLKAGYLVCRVREHPLPSLKIQDPNYFELTVHSGVQSPVGEVLRIEAWLSREGFK